MLTSDTRKQCCVGVDSYGTIHTWGLIRISSRWHMLRSLQINCCWYIDLFCQYYCRLSFVGFGHSLDALDCSSVGIKYTKETEFSMGTLTCLWSRAPNAASCVLTVMTSFNYCMIHANPTPQGYHHYQIILLSSSLSFTNDIFMDQSTASFNLDKIIP